MLYPIILFVLTWPLACAQETSPWSGDVLGKLYTYDAKPDYLLYKFSFSSLAIQNYGIGAIPGYTCKALITPGYIPIGKYGNIELRSADPANTNWRYFRDLPCCFLHATQPCPGCYRNSEYSPLSGRRAVITITVMIKDVEVQRLVSTFCLYCVQYACATSFCANGEVSHPHHYHAIQN
jgi:hypothetical protein